MLCETKEEDGEVRNASIHPSLLNGDSSNSRRPSILIRICAANLLVAAAVSLSGCEIQFTPEPIPLAFPSGEAPLPSSGYELEYVPELWNDGGEVQFSTNCYAYMLGSRLGHPINDKPQPGDLSGDYYIRNGGPIGVDKIVELTKSDAEFVDIRFEDSTAEASCPSGSYKVALVIDPLVDYHWYRQNPDGTWSSKSGWLPVTELDASGHTISDPRMADRDYGFVNYTEFGGFFCTASR